MIVAQVCDAGLSVDEELTLAFTFADPIKSFLLDGVVGEAFDGGVFDLDWFGRLWVPQFAE